MVGVVRWKFTDVWAATPVVYVFDINPNAGGSPNVGKTLTINYNAGPRKGGIIQEGPSSSPELTFSGVILTQQHYEKLEEWYDKKILVQLDDDLGRVFQGVFTRFSPQRARRAFNPWYHTYDAGFTCYGYKNASGQFRYGKF